MVARRGVVMGAAPRDIGVGGLGGLDRAAWDVVVIGAGPGGSLAARLLALRGRSVLLVEKSVFPRWKVCGACLGAAGVGVLERCGLGDRLGAIGARAVPRAEIWWGGRSGSVRLKGMMTVSRNAMDSALAESAAAAGAEVRYGVRATASPDGCVRLVADDGDAEVRAGAVINAGGLRAARGEESSVRPDAWIGLGATSACDGFGDWALTMVVGARGYVGRIVTEDGRANWGAAFDPGLVKDAGSPGEAVARLCAGNTHGWSPPMTGWVGTPALTRRVAVIDGLVCRVGDAAGYVEPITGEGMSWALLGAEALVPVIDRALGAGRAPSEWGRVHARLMRGRRLRCAVVARGLRSPAAMRVAMALLGGGAGQRPRAFERGVDRMVGGLIGGRA